MKNVISILLVLAMALSLCACGGESIAEKCVGEWMVVEGGEPDHDGVTDKITLYEGGIGRWEYNAGLGLYWPQEWKVEDGYVILFSGNSKYVLKLNEDRLVATDGTLVLQKAQ